MKLFLLTFYLYQSSYKLKYVPQELFWLHPGKTFIFIVLIFSKYFSPQESLIFPESLLLNLNIPFISPYEKCFFPLILPILLGTLFLCNST